jgi:SMODS-associated and fused to various effectors sensor domain
MRLATGPVGAQLSEVAGFKVAVTGREGEWTSTTPREPATVEREWIDIDQGDDLAAVIAVSQPIWEDILAHIRTETLPIGKLVIYSAPGGPNREAVKSPEVGVGMAAAISQALRADTSGRRDGLHLFKSAPL